MRKPGAARIMGALMLAAVTGLAACDTGASDVNLLRSTETQAKPAPAMRWGDRSDGREWTRAALAALEAEGVTLLSTVPSDVDAFCPRYAALDRESRKHFWVGLLSSVAKHESSYNPAAQGGGGRYLGLMQISPATARHYNCDAQLLDGSQNMACAIRIAAVNVSRDNAIVSGQGNGWRGIARDWMPLRSAAKRADIAGWTRGQSYCGGQAAQ